MITDRPTPVLYLDIDGTVRQGKDDALGRFVNGPEDVVVFPEAVEMMRRWKAGGGRIIGVSNQGGIALGIVDERQVAAAMVATYAQAEQLFDKIAYCKAPPRRQAPRDGPLLVPQTQSRIAHRVGARPRRAASRRDLPAVHGPHGRRPARGRGVRRRRWPGLPVGRRLARAGVVTAPPYLNRSPWHSRRDHAADTVTAAMERQAAKRLAHQARLASGETT
jgi:hypothetical protein